MVVLGIESDPTAALQRSTTTPTRELGADHNIGPATRRVTVHQRRLQTALPSHALGLLFVSPIADGEHLGPFLIEAAPLDEFGGRIEWCDAPEFWPRLGDGKHVV